MNARSFYGSVPARLSARNDNRATRDVTFLTMMAFGPSLVVAIVFVAYWLVRVW